MLLCHFRALSLVSILCLQIFPTPLLAASSSEDPRGENPKESAPARDVLVRLKISDTRLSWARSQVFSVVGRDIIIKSQSTDKSSHVQLSGLQKLQFQILPPTFSTNRELQSGEGFDIKIYQDSPQGLKPIATGSQIDIISDQFTVDGRPTSGHERFAVVVTGEIRKINQKTVSQQKTDLNLQLRKRGDRTERLDISHLRQANLTRVAVLPWREYLQGVLPSEIPMSWPNEAVKAQIVASSSYLLARLRDRRLAGWWYDVEPTVMDQVYQRSPAGLKDSSRSRLKDLINEVGDVVLGDMAGGILTAYFHADCGGRTEQGDRVWPSDHSKSVSCPYRSRAPWSVKLTLEQIANGLNTNTPIRKLVITKVKDSLQNSERVQSVQIITDINPSSFAGLNSRVGSTEGSASGSKGRSLSSEAGSAHHDSGGARFTLTGHEFRMKMGHDQILSSQFKIRELISEGRLKGYEFVGFGRGHGVGLCQQGAAMMAKQGASYRLILNHFYPQAGLEGRAQSLAKLGERLDLNEDLDDKKQEPGEREKVAKMRETVFGSAH
jgi:SpoIID/LytB domain protein